MTPSLFSVTIQSTLPELLAPTLLDIRAVIDLLSEYDVPERVLVMLNGK
jgi:hypothetical protein